MAKSQKVPPSGIYVPATIFFAENEDIDEQATEAHILRLAKGGVTGILIQGSNGEAQHLSHPEKSALLRLTRKTLDSNGFQNVVIIAGTGAQSTRESIQLCEEAAEAGASHALVLTPAVFPPSMTRDSILQFHRAVADKSPIPTMVYNFPVVTAGMDLDSNIVGELAKHPNIVGTKLSCGNVGKLHRLTSTIPASEFAVFPGVSSVFIPSLVVGGAGVIGALVNLVPKVHAHAHKLYNEGKLAEAVALQGKIAVADQESLTFGGIGCLKALTAQHFGYGNPRVRGPLSAPSAESLTKVKGTALEELLELEKTL